MRFYSQYIDYLKSIDMLEATLHRHILPWTANAICHLFDQYEFNCILEIGRDHGHTYGLFRWLAPDAHITSIDPVPTQVAEDLAMGMTDDGMRGSWVFVDAKSQAVLRKGDLKGPYDFVLIDGDHTYKGAKADWEGIQPLLAKDAVVLFDNLDHSGKCGRVFHEIQETGTLRKVEICPQAVWPAKYKGTSGLVIIGEGDA